MGTKERVLKYLQEFGSLSDTEARDDIGTRRLSEYIRQLREEGYGIDTVWEKSKNRYGEKVRFGRYIYKGRCEVFCNGKCTGCQGQEENIDLVKYKCETYNKEMKI